MIPSFESLWGATRLTLARGDHARKLTAGRTIVGTSRSVRYASMLSGLAEYDGFFDPQPVVAVSFPGAGKPGEPALNGQYAAVLDTGATHCLLREDIAPLVTGHHTGERKNIYWGAAIPGCEGFTTDVHVGRYGRLWRRKLTFYLFPVARSEGRPLVLIGCSGHTAERLFLTYSLDDRRSALWLSGGDAA